MDQQTETQAGPVEQAAPEANAKDENSSRADAEEASAFEDPRLAIGTTPISADAVAGEDIREDPDFDALETEFRKIETEGPNAVRWNDVIEMSAKLLDSRTKDLMVATWLTYGLHREESFKGLAVGLGIIHGLIDKFWAEMFPPVRRERGRVGAMEWLVGRLAVPVSEATPSKADAPYVIAANDYLLQIDDLLSAKLEKTEAALGELVRALRPHAQAAKQAIAEEKKTEEARAKAAEAATAQPAPAAADNTPAKANGAGASAPASVAAAAPAVSLPPNASDADLEKAARELETAMKRLSSALRRKNTADPRPYLLVRSAGLASLKELPADQGGKTLIPPPNKMQLDGMEGKLGAGMHAEALPEIENLVASSPCWLTGNHRAATALGALGESHAAARAVVVAMTRTLLTRFPDLIDMTFSDGTPFADDGGRRWIAETVMAGEGSAVVSGDDPRASALIEARGLAAKGKANDGLRLLAEVLGQIRGHRDQMLWQLDQAEFCLENKLVPVAVSLLEHLDRVVDDNEIETWEPELAGRVAELRCRVFLHPDVKKMPGAEQNRQALEKSRQRLARIDLAAAAKLSG